MVAFLRTGRSLEFTARTLYAAPHPNWGASGIDLVDLDRDGDTDVLMTHGDSFDDNLLKPYHGIQWLENTGGLRFREHRLATLPGAHRAQAADLDGDGDLDIVGVALVANEGTRARKPCVGRLARTGRPARVRAPHARNRRAAPCHPRRRRLRPGRRPGPRDRLVRVHPDDAGVGGPVGEHAQIAAVAKPSERSRRCASSWRSRCRERWPGAVSSPRCRCDPPNGKRRRKASSPRRRKWRCSAAERVIRCRRPTSCRRRPGATSSFA